MRLYTQVTLKADFMGLDSCLLQNSYHTFIQINKRILALVLDLDSCLISLVQTYAPQQGRPREEEIDFYHQLHDSTAGTGRGEQPVGDADVVSTETTDDGVGVAGVWSGGRTENLPPLNTPCPDNSRSHSPSAPATSPQCKKNLRSKR